MMSEFFERIKTGLEDVVAYEQGDTTKARIRIRETAPLIVPPTKYAKDEIKILRTKLNLSQRAFADILGVSKKTVEAWERGANKPCGSSSRLIEWIEHDNSLISRCQAIHDINHTHIFSSSP
jgi:putative transcriptional regulator